MWIEPSRRHAPKRRREPISNLVHAAGLRTSALTAQASMTTQSMGKLIDGLESKGYVESRPDPAD